MYGETHVDPQRLFNPADAAPPADALDVQFPVPTSLSLFGDALARTPHMAHRLPELASIYEQVLGSALRDIQRAGGYVEDPAWGPSTPARLSLTAISENALPGESIMRIHGHIYVGRTAASLKDGQVRPVNLKRLKRGIDNVVWGNYAKALRSATADVFGLVWAPLPGHHPADCEIVEPPFASHVARHPAPDANPCLGRFGPLERIMADLAWRIDIAESQVRVQSEQRWAG